MKLNIFFLSLMLLLSVSAALAAPLTTPQVFPRNVTFPEASTGVLNASFLCFATGNCFTDTVSGSSGSMWNITTSVYLYNNSNILDLNSTALDNHVKAYANATIATFSNGGYIPKSSGANQDLIESNLRELNSVFIINENATVLNITSGEWRATPIADSYVSSASTWNGYATSIAGLQTQNTTNYNVFLNTSGFDAANLTSGTVPDARVSGTFNNQSFNATCSGQFLTGVGLNVDSSLNYSCATPSGAGDITDVIAGTGLTGGATSGSATLNLNGSYVASIVGNYSAVASLLYTNISGLQTQNATNYAFFLNNTGFSAANLTSGTVPTARLSGSYTGITGVGTVTAGTWSATAIAANKGGTGQTTYTVGDILYASSTSALSKLNVGTANYVLSSTGSIPVWRNLTNGITLNCANITGATSNLCSLTGGGNSSANGSAGYIPIFTNASNIQAWLTTADIINSSSSAGGDISGTFSNLQIAADTVTDVELGTVNLSNLVVTGVPPDCSATSSTDNVFMFGFTNLSYTDCLALNESNITISNLAGSLGISQIGATGTPSSSTYLRGDGTWSSISSGSGNVSGNGTSGYVTRWNGSTTIATGILRDNGSNAAVGAAPVTNVSLRVAGILTSPMTLSNVTVGGVVGLNSGAVSHTALAFVNDGNEDHPVVWGYNGLTQGQLFAIGSRSFTSDPTSAWDFNSSIKFKFLNNGEARLAILNATGNVYAGGNITASTDGSTQSSPRIFGFSDLSSNEAARFRFGDDANYIQNAFGYSTVVGSYHPLILLGGTGSTSAASFTAYGSDTTHGTIVYAGNVNPYALTARATTGGNNVVQNWENGSNVSQANVSSTGVAWFNGGLLLGSNSSFSTNSSCTTIKSPSGTGVLDICD